MGTVVITGANGFVGRSLIQLLSRQKEFSVVGVDIQESGSNGYLFCSADIRNDSCIDVISRLKPDIIVHLAGLLSKADDAQSRTLLINANVNGTMHVLEAAKVNKSKFIFSSSGLVYGNQKGPFTEDMACIPEDFYGYSKFAAEEMIRLYSRRYGLPFAIFRAAVLYGPSQGGSMFIPSVVKSLLAGETFPMTEGEQTRDFLYIDDFISALELAARSNLNGTFNVGTGSAITMKSAARMVEEVIGSKELLQIGALPYRVNESWQYCLSPEKLVKETGWTPKVGLKDGLKKVVSFERASLSAVK